MNTPNGQTIELPQEWVTPNPVPPMRTDINDDGTIRNNIPRDGAPVIPPGLPAIMPAIEVPTPGNAVHSVTPGKGQ